jgi:hypothetical protein
MQATRGVNGPPQGQLACLVLSCLCVETPVVAQHRCFALPRPVIRHPVRVHKYVPGRQVNAVWGQCPAVRAMYVTKIGVYWGLVDKISPASGFEGNSGVLVVARSFQRGRKFDQGGPGRTRCQTNGPY